jgi:hypothetical protein
MGRGRRRANRRDGRTPQCASFCQSRVRRTATSPAYIKELRLVGTRARTPSPSPSPSSSPSPVCCNRGCSRGPSPMPIGGCCALVGTATGHVRQLTPRAVSKCPFQEQPGVGQCRTLRAQDPPMGAAGGRGERPCPRQIGDGDARRGTGTSGPGGPGCLRPGTGPGGAGTRTSGTIPQALLSCLVSFTISNSDLLSGIRVAH